MKLKFSRAINVNKRSVWNIIYNVLNSTKAALGGGDDGSGLGFQHDRKLEGKEPALTLEPHIQN